ncbi:porin family protein [Shewanella colwelliana]|nr:porin family protein [Shewanella colwelliana]
MTKMHSLSVSKTSIGKTMLKAIPLTLALAFAHAAYADEIQFVTQAPSVAQQNVFERYGISDEILKLGLSSLSHGDQLVEHVQRRFDVGGDVTESDVFLVQSTDRNGNIDLRIKYDESKLDSKEDVIGNIEKITKIEYRLKNYLESFDKSSVIVNELSPEVVEISFNYSKYGLPQDIAYFRFMRVKLTVINGSATQMEITNAKPYDYEGYRVEQYSQKIEFTTLANGKTVIESKQIEATGNKGQRAVNYSSTIRPVAFYDDELGTIVIDQGLLSTVSDPRIREEKVDLDRLFPILGDLVRQQGIDVPLPYGFSVAYRNQDMNVGFDSFDIMGLNLDEFFDPSSSFGTVSAESYTLRADINILPFWNVYGVVGKVNVDAVVDAQYTGKMKDVFEDKLGVVGGKLACSAVAGAGVDLCSPGEVSVPLHLDYDVAGIGTTLSVGYKEFFASVTATYSATRLEGQDNWGDGILTIQPMLGYQFLDSRAQVFVGAEYQGLKATMSGNLGYIDALGRDFTYDVGVELEQWAYLVGFNKQIGRNYNITALYNKGETRSSFTINFGYRF